MGAGLRAKKPRLRAWGPTGACVGAERGAREVAIAKRVAVTCQQTEMRRVCTARLTRACGAAFLTATLQTQRLHETTGNMAGAAGELAGAGQGGYAPHVSGQGGVCATCRL